MEKEKKGIHLPALGRRSKQEETIPEDGRKAKAERAIPFSKADDAPVYPDPVPGRTALVLSGGGSRGAYQVGVWQALREMDVPIHIAVGTSIGALNAAAVTQNAYENAVALWNQLETDMIFDYANVVENRGVKFTTIKDVLRKNLIEENIRASDVDFGIVTVKFPSMEPLYMWKEDMPEGEMLDYILASSSVFPAVTPYEIHDEKFLDGGYHDVMPVSMALEKGAERIIAVDLDTTGILRKEAIEYAGDRLTIVQCHWELGSFLVFDTDNARHIMRLGYLDALKTFGILEGYRYSFGRGQMGKRSLRPAEYAAHAFSLDPEIIYTSDMFMEKLGEQIKQYVESKDSELEDLRRRLRKLSILQFERSIDQIRSASRRALIVYSADLIRADLGAADPENKAVKEPPAPFRKLFEKLFASDIAAAAWLVKNNLI